MPENFVSSQSISEIEKHKAAFEKDFHQIIVSDTVQRILLASTPIDDSGHGEIVNDEHIEELNDMIGKAARDLTKDAIKGKLIKTEFNEYEQPTNFLDSISQAAEELVGKESLQRSLWFQEQIRNGKIPDASKNYESFNIYLKRLFANKNFSVEDYETALKVRIEAARSFEEENIIEEIRNSVTNEVTEAEVRQNHIVEVMQEVEDTKKEYEEEVEGEASEDELADLDMSSVDDAEGEDTGNADDDPNDEALSGEEGGEGSEGASGIAHSGDTKWKKLKPNDADKLADKVAKKKAQRARENMDEGGEQNTPPEAGGGDDGQSANNLAPYQNRDNFGGATNSMGVGGYNGPEGMELGSGVLEAEENESKTVDDAQAGNMDSNPNTTQQAENDANKAADNTADELKTKLGPGDEENPEGESFINPLRGADEAETNPADPNKEPPVNQSEVPAKAKEALAIIPHMFPLSIAKFTRSKIFGSEALARYMFRLGENRKPFIDSVETRMREVEYLIENEPQDLPYCKKKLAISKEEWNKAKTKVLELDYTMSNLGLNADSIISKESLFTLAVAKNVLNRSNIMRAKKRKYKPIVKDPSKYANSVEAVVDEIFLYQTLSNRLHYAQNISQAREALIEKEEQLNGNIYHLTDEDKQRALNLKNLLGNGNFDKLFIANDLKLDFDNIFYRVKETNEHPKNTLMESEFTDKVLQNLEKKGLNIDASLEELVVDIITKRKDPTIYNAPLFTCMLDTMGRKVLGRQAQLGAEALGNQVENSKIYTKAKVYLTILRGAERLGLASKEFKEAFELEFKYTV